LSTNSHASYTAFKDNIDVRKLDVNDFEDFHEALVSLNHEELVEAHGRILSLLKAKLAWFDTGSSGIVGASVRSPCMDRLKETTSHKVMTPIQGAEPS
jgi:hypothetical protein